MKKILPIFDKPPLVGLDDYTHILSMILNSPKAYAWVAENYVQLIGNDDLGNDIMLYNFMDYHILYNTEYCFVANNRVCPFLDIYRDSFEECQNKDESISSYLKSKIINNYYLFLFLDISKIPAYNCANSARHCPLIFGFDDEEEVFYFRDYCGARYGTYTVKYDAMEQAIIGFLTSQDIIKSIDYDIIYQYGINRIRLVDFDYVFKIDRLKSLLQDYLEGNKIKDIYNKFAGNVDCSYGIDVIT